MVDTESPRKPRDKCSKHSRQHQPRAQEWLLRCQCQSTSASRQLLLLSYYKEKLGLGFRECGLGSTFWRDSLHILYISIYLEGIPVCQFMGGAIL